MICYSFFSFLENGHSIRSFKLLCFFSCIGMESGPRMFLDAVAKGKLHLAKFIVAASDNSLDVLNVKVST